MNNTHRGLPLARARIEQIFPKLTSTQIRRITPHGRIRTAKRGEVLSEQGDSAASFFVVVSGELEILRPSGAVETLVTVHRSGQFTGEVGTLSVQSQLGSKGKGEAASAEAATPRVSVLERMSRAPESEIMPAKRGTSRALRSGTTGTATKRAKKQAKIASMKSRLG